MKKKGISLILLVITIIIIIIIASAVILNLNNNNPVDKARVANVQSTRDSLKSGINLYIAKIMVKENGNHYASTMILGKNAEVESYGIIAGSYIQNTVNKVVIFGNKEVWQLDYTKVNSEVGIKLDMYDSSSRWYIDEYGNPYLVYDKLSNVSQYLKDETGNVAASVRDFVVYLDQDIEFAENSTNNNNNQNEEPNNNNNQSGKEEGNIVLMQKSGAVTYTNSINITVANPNSAQISAVSSDETIVPNSNIVITNNNTQNVTITATALSKAGNATITITGGETASYNAVNKTYTLTVWNEESTEEIPVSVAKNIINSSNIVNYIGKAVDYHPQDDSTGVYRIFYLDTTNKYGDGTNTLYLKRDYNSSTTYNVVSSAITDSSTYSATDLRKFNPLWASTDNNINNSNETYAAYLCTKANWITYKTSDALYAVGSPSIEMYMDAYNQWKGYTSNQTNSPLNYKFVSGEYGYSVGANGSYANSGDYTNINTLEVGPNNIFMTSGSNYWWLASPGRYNEYRVHSVNGYYALADSTYNETLGVCPVVSLGNNEECLTVQEAKSVINEDNISSYIGTKVDYHPEGDSTGIYRVLYLDTTNKYGDGTNTLYLKRDYDDSLKVDDRNWQGYTTGTNPTRTFTSTEVTTITNAMKKMNKEWSTKDGILSQRNEYVSAYLCNPAEWTSYKTADALYAVGSPSVEMYMDAYNQWGGYASGKGPLNYKYELSKYGYEIRVNTDYTNSGNTTKQNGISDGPNGIFMGSNTAWWLASPALTYNYYVIYVAGWWGGLYADREQNLSICPVVALGN